MTIVMSLLSSGSDGFAMSIRLSVETAAHLLPSSYGKGTCRVDMVKVKVKTSAQARSNLLQDERFIQLGP